MKQERIHNLLLLLLSLVSMMIFHICYKYHFFVQEQNQIFVYSRQYIAEYCAQNAVLSTLAGDFLTQFFYYLYVGPAECAAVILLIAIESKRCFDKIFAKKVSFIIAIIIQIVLIFTVFNHRFGIEFLLSVFIGFASYDLYTTLLKKEGIISATITLLITYYIGGFAQLFFASIFTIKLLKNKQLTPSLTVALIAFAIPIVGHRIFQTTYPKNLLYPGIHSPALPDRYTEFSYAIETEYYFRHFDKLERLALQQDTMSAQSGIYYNMIQAQKGILPDKIKAQKIPELGTLVHIDENSPLEAINLMNDFYYLIGDMAMAERAAIMAQVFSPNNRNIKMIKRLCEINLVTGDTAIAMKYVRILEKTLLYREWANRHNPYALDKKIEVEIIEKRKYTNTTNAIRVSDNCREILLQLLDSNPDNTIALDYLLCTDLILGQLQTFKADYYRFCIKNNRPRLKKIYTDALEK